MRICIVEDNRELASVIRMRWIPRSVKSAVPADMDWQSVKRDGISCFWM